MIWAHSAARTGPTTGLTVPGRLPPNRRGWMTLTSWPRARSPVARSEATKPLSLISAMRMGEAPLCRGLGLFAKASAYLREPLHDVDGDEPKDNRNRKHHRDAPDERPAQPAGLGGVDVERA